MKKQNQLVFIDESGDPGFNFAGGASDYFTISIVVFSSKDDAQCMMNAVFELKQRFNIKGELKFSKSSHERRIEYLRAINKCDFSGKIIVVNKHLITNKNLTEKPKLFYRFVLNRIITYTSLERAKIVLDGRGSKTFAQELKSYLNEDNGAVREFVMKDSKKDELLQVADVITGAIAWGYKNNAQVYGEILDKNKVKVWEFK